jgi:uncharacterized protein (DUF885 family)
MPDHDLKKSAGNVWSLDVRALFASLAARFPVCMASDEFHFFPQARAEPFDWSAWDDFSPEGLSGAVAQLKDWEQQIDRGPGKALSFEQEIDAAMLARVLGTLREQLDLVRTHATQPTFYLTIIGIGLAEACEAGPPAMEVRARRLPGFIDQAIGNLTRVPRLFCELGAEMLAEQQAWVAALFLPEALKTSLLDALRRLASHLGRVAITDDFLPDVGLYERIAKHHMGCFLEPDDIARELEMEIEETRAILNRSAMALNPGQPWQRVIEKLPRPAMPSGGALDVYGKTIAELGRHCQRRGFVTEKLLHQCPVRVEPIPAYLRTVRSHAAYSMPPVHPPRGGVFFIEAVNGAEPLPADYRLLTAHETFPGHHLLDTSRWLQERLVRRHVEFPIFYEGWASFAEELLFETGFFSGPLDRLLMAKRRFWRAVRGQADFDIHMRRRTPEEAAHDLVSQGMPPHRAGAMVRRYSLKPGYQLAYTLGRRRFRALYDALPPKARDPAAFARQVLAFGEISFHHLEQKLKQGE